MAAGGGDIFFMRTPQDLSGSDGEIVLFEYSEEFPPIMNRVSQVSSLNWRLRSSLVPLLTLHITILLDRHGYTIGELLSPPPTQRPLTLSRPRWQQFTS